ncbi:MAG: hypothetical protein ACRDBG_12965 [Waterburya sp.]
MAIVPCGHRIVVKQEKLENVDKAYQSAQKAGIVIPELDEHTRTKNSVDQGLVLAVGPSAFKDFNAEVPWCKVGDTIVFARYSGKKVKDPENEQEYIVLNDEDCVAVITKGSHE